jgi:hypothetical protein
MRMRRIVLPIIGLSGCTIFFHVVSNGTILEEKSLNTKRVF